MPKNKSHSGASKRFKITGSGKVLRERAGKRHLLEHKSSRVTRRLTGNAEMAPGDAAKIKKLLGSDAPARERRTYVRPGPNRFRAV